MKIGVIGAMAQEVALLKEQLGEMTTWKKSGATFYSGKMNGHEMIVVQSGIGKVLSSITTSLLIQQYDVDLVINTGSAGGIGQGLAVGDIVIADKLAYHDVDATVFGYQYGQVPGGMPLYYEADPVFAKVMTQAAEETNQVVKSGLIVTGDSFIADPIRLKEILQNFPEALACEMEGAGIAQTAYQFEVPCLVVRAMSDTADQDATVSFDEFIELAGKRSAEMVLRFINLCE